MTQLPEGYIEKFRNIMQKEATMLRRITMPEWKERCEDISVYYDILATTYKPDISSEKVVIYIGPSACVDIRLLTHEEIEQKLREVAKDAVVLNNSICVVFNFIETN